MPGRILIREAAMKRFDYYEEDDRSEQMQTYASHCRRFSRRSDFDVFNMTTYQSCENCRHLSADNQCSVKAQNRILPFE